MKEREDAMLSRGPSNEMDLQRQIDGAPPYVSASENRARLTITVSATVSGATRMWAFAITSNKVDEEGDEGTDASREKNRTVLRCGANSAATSQS
jgi:hypothetical protein